jgi:glutathione peroxidase
MPDSNAHAFSFVSLDGSPLPIAGFAGRAVLVVNTASECGYTPQYADLQRLWREWRGRGLVVLGVPSNDFGEQESGDATAIRSFCTERYAVDFPLSRKERVIGAGAHPFYQWIAAELGEDAAPRWNFHKYLIAPDGSLAGAWPASVRPADPAIVGTVAEVLA